MSLAGKFELELLGLPLLLHGLAPQTFLPKDTFKLSFCYDPGPCPPTHRFEDRTETRIGKLKWRQTGTPCGQH
jgi:hypothetical protein